MRVAVFLEADVNVGGGFQQSYSVVDCLLKHPSDDIEYVFFVFSGRNHKILNGLGVQNVWIRKTPRRIISRIFRKFMRLFFGVIIPFQGYLDGILTRHRIDLVYFLSPSLHAMGLRKHGFIITIWDQCHRDWVEFPEVRDGFEFESREYMYRNVLPKAVAILVDAESSREKMHSRYGIDPDRIHVAGFFPMPSGGGSCAEDADVCSKYSVARPFVFYPAQFWSHKNHCYILEAVSMMRDKHMIDVVFTGNDYGNENAVREYASRLGISERCHFLGFVPREELTAFYKSAAALVMPTYFGPTNIPPLEAFYYGCPVCYSDLPGLRDQVGDAAFLMDLDDPASLVRNLEVLLRGGADVQSRIEKGYGVLKRYTPEKYMETVEDILGAYKKTTRYLRN